eukprot:7648987-Lingulodinium_polyedra.AAC.1
MDNAIPKDVLDEQDAAWAVQQQQKQGGPLLVRRRVQNGAIARASDPCGAAGSEKQRPERQT